MDASEFRKRGREMVDYIADYMETIHTRRVLPEVQPGYLQQMLPSKAPRQGENWEDIMKDVENTIMPGITHWQHPRFHAYFPAGNSYPSILGDMLSDAIGCVGFSWAASPACTELETVVLDWLAKMINLPAAFLHANGEGGGVIQGSASECILVTLLAARFAAIRNLKQKYPYAEEGILLSKCVAYCSKLAHSCVEKAGMIGLVKMRELDIDENYSVRGHTLAKAIEVCATLGTTAVCSFDSLNEIGPLCDKEGLWLHVDAAYAGSALICPEFQHILKGIEYASSFNFNPNKWMLVNFDCSTMWVKDRDALAMALTVDPLYLQHNHSVSCDARGYLLRRAFIMEADCQHWQIPLSRRFRSLKLWFVIRSYGQEGLQKYIREHVRLAKKFEELVRNDARFEVLGKVVMGLVCFRLKGHNFKTQTLLRAINMSGKIHMVPALLNDFYVIRFAICAQNADDDDIVHAWNVVSQMATTVMAACENNKENEVEIEIEDLDADSEVVDENSEAITKDDDEVFLYDDNIPSIPTRYDPGKNSPTPYRRRNQLLKMISDPKCYHPRVLKALCQNNKRHTSESSKYVPSDGFYYGTPV